MLTKVEIHSTSIEDVNTIVKNMNNKYAVFKQTTDKLETNIREQLDIIQSLNGKINQTGENQQKFKQDIFERFVGLSEDLMTKQGKEDLERSRRVIELTEKFEGQMKESIDEIMTFRKDFNAYKELKEGEV